MERVGVIGIVVQAPCEQVGKLQDLLSSYSDIIVGRMGVPVRECNINAISVIVKGSNERISALCGKLGKIDGLAVKSALTSLTIE